MDTRKKNLSSSRKSYERLEQVIGCKWSVSVLEALRLGINRPGMLERSIEGISTKVLSERLRKLTAYGLLERHVYAELPPRTEYVLTETGKALLDIIGKIHELDREIEQSLNESNEM
jgi:DNA-binding HxlR family transcriptional regulator